MIRLQKYLAECGVASRRGSEQLIREGCVTVNGRVAELGQAVDPAADQVRLRGEPVCKDVKVYILLNKPKGVVTTARDTHERRTVLDCVNKIDSRVFPVGRLDMDVEGVLLLTNDFSKLVLISNLIAWPIAYIVMNRWLENFAYRIDLGVSVFLLAGGGVLLVALLAVSTQVLRIARVDPAATLRDE